MIKFLKYKNSRRFKIQFHALFYNILCLFFYSNDIYNFDLRDFFSTVLNYEIKQVLKISFTILLPITCDVQNV